MKMHLSKHAEVHLHLCRKCYKISNIRLVKTSGRTLKATDIPQDLDNLTNCKNAYLSHFYKRHSNKIFSPNVKRV